MLPPAQRQIGPRTGVGTGTLRAAGSGPGWDEADIRRFLLLIDEFTTSVQFLVITHNKLTMLKTHSLLGVTMEEKGVCKTIGIDLQEVGEEGLMPPGKSGSVF